MALTSVTSLCVDYKQRRPDHDTRRLYGLLSGRSSALLDFQLRRFQPTSEKSLSVLWVYNSVIFEAIGTCYQPPSDKVCRRLYGIHNIVIPQPQVKRFTVTHRAYLSSWSPSITLITQIGLGFDAGLWIPRKSRYPKAHTFHASKEIRNNKIHRTVGLDGPITASQHRKYILLGDPTSRLGTYLLQAW